jgi:hypothetical protein
MVSGTATRVLALGPFFDHSLQLVRATATAWQPAQLTVAIQPTTVSLPSVASGPSNLRVVDASSLPALQPKLDSRRITTAGYLHAKALAIETNDGLWLALGSANPSAPAWLQGETGNAEAVVVLSGDTAREAFVRLGLDSLHSLPQLTEEVLKNLAANAADRTDVPEQRADKVQMAMVTDDRIRLCAIDAAACRRAIDLGDDEHELPATFFVGPEGAEMAIAGPHGPVIRIEGENGPLTTVILHSMPQIRSATRPHSSARILDQLGCLDAVDADLDGIIDALDRYIFNEDAAKAQAGRARGPATASETGTEAPFGPRGVSMASVGGSPNRGSRIVEFELAEIISLLIRDLTDAQVADGDRRALDPDDAEGVPAAEETETVNQHESVIDWDRLVAACRKRLGLLLNKLRTKLVEPIQGPERAVWLFGRLLLTLSLIRNLRSRRPAAQTSQRRGRPESLVSIQQVRLAYKIAMEALYRTEGGIAAHLESSTDHRSATERSTLDALLLWAAMEIGADAEAKPIFGEDREHKARRLSDKADAIVASMSAAAHPDIAGSPLARRPAQLWRDSASQIGPEWWQRHLGIGVALQNAAQRDGWLPSLKRSPREGDIVVWMAEPTFPRVIASASGNKVCLFSPGIENDSGYHRLTTTAVTPLDEVQLHLN